MEVELLDRLEISISEACPLVVDLLIFATFDVRFRHRVNNGVVPFNKVLEGGLLAGHLDNLASPAVK